jgi:hypothetical protein
MGRHPIALKHQVGTLNGRVMMAEAEKVCEFMWRFPGLLESFVDVPFPRVWPGTVW